MPNLNFKNFILTNKNEKKIILDWRNSDRIRLKMNNSEIISFENHLKWIEGIESRKDCIYYLFYVDKTPVGVFDFTNIDFENKTCECGSYIGNIDFLGFGILLNYLGFEYAFDNLKMNKVNISVLKNNQRVYKMHKTIFYAEDLTDNEHEYFLFINKNNWNSKKQELKNLILKYYNNTNKTKWEN